MISCKFWVTEKFCNFHTVLMTYPFTITEKSVRYVLYVIAYNHLQNYKKVLQHAPLGTLNHIDGQHLDANWLVPTELTANVVAANCLHSLFWHHLERLILIWEALEVPLEDLELITIFWLESLQPSYWFYSCYSLWLWLAFADAERYFTHFCTQFLKTQLSPFWSCKLLTSSLHFCLSICI